MKIYENLDLQDSDGEVWKVIENFPEYQVSNFGKVKRSTKDKYNRRLKILKQRKTNRGYLKVNLYKNGKYKTHLTHQLVYKTFYNYEQNDEYIIHHKDKNKENNYYKNLEIKLKLNHSKLHNIGENNSKHILTNRKIIQIKMLFKLGFKNIEISKIYNIAKNTVSQIKTGKRWSHIKLNGEL